MNKRMNICRIFGFVGYNDALEYGLQLMRRVVKQKKFNVFSFSVIAFETAWNITHFRNMSCKYATFEMKISFRPY